MAEALSGVDECGIGRQQQGVSGSSRMVGDGGLGGDEYGSSAHSEHARVAGSRDGIVWMTCP